MHSSSALALSAILLSTAFVPRAFAKDTSATLSVSVTVVAPATRMTIAIPAGIDTSGTENVLCPGAICPRVDISSVRLSSGETVSLMTIQY